MTIGVKIDLHRRSTQLKSREQQTKFLNNQHPLRDLHVIAVWDNKPTMRQGVVDGTEIVIK